MMSSKRQSREKQSTIYLTAWVLVLVVKSLIKRVNKSTKLTPIYSIKGQLTLQSEVTLSEKFWNKSKSSLNINHMVSLKLNMRY